MDQSKYVCKLSIWMFIQICMAAWGFCSVGMTKENFDFPYIVQLPENENVILVEKKTQTFFIYARGENKWIEKLRVPCSTGEVGGIKQQAGDKKTPEGIYFLKDEYEDKYLSAVYGKKAFPIDYPNFMDKAVGKNGSAIWIHGTNKALKPMDSNGCIALENSNVVKIPGYVNLDTTPVIIVEQIEYENRNHQKELSRALINGLLEKWTSALEKGSYQDYLSFYASHYLPEISFWPEWLKTRNHLSGRNVEIRLENRGIGIYYHEKIYVALFDQVLNFHSKKIFLGKRKLFLSKKGSDYKIVGDVYQFVPDHLSKENVPLLAAVETLPDPEQRKERILRTLEAWLAAWSSKDMETYASFYAENFYSDGMNKRQWVKRKNVLSKKYDYIRVDGSLYKIKLLKNRCEVSFFQIYESSGFIAQGTKRLKLIKIGGLWKIYQESWKKK